MAKLIKKISLQIQQEINRMILRYKLAQSERDIKAGRVYNLNSLDDLDR